jgi:hypothetical protein
MSGSQEGMIPLIRSTHPTYFRLFESQTIISVISLLSWLTRDCVVGEEAVDIVSCGSQKEKLCTLLGLLVVSDVILF